MLVEDNQWRNNFGRYDRQLETIIRGDQAGFRLEDTMHADLKARFGEARAGEKKDLLVIVRKVDDEWKVLMLKFISPEVPLADAFAQAFLDLEEVPPAPAPGDKP